MLEEVLDGAYYDYYYYYYYYYDAYIISLLFIRESQKSNLLAIFYNYTYLPDEKYTSIDAIYQDNES